jgi:hypothetical protein
MAKFIGRLVDVGIARETSRGTFVTPAYRVPKTAITIEDKVAKVNTRASFNNIGYEGDQALVAQKWAEGDLECPLFDRSFGVILCALLGVPTTSAPASGVYTHTFALQNDNQHPSLSIVVAESTISAVAFRLAMIETLELTFQPDQQVMVKVTFMSKRSADWTITWPSIISENKFIGRDLNFKMATLTSGLAAASNIPLRSLTLKFAKRLRMDSVLGTVDPQDFINQAFSIEGDIELNLEDKTYKALMMDGSYRAVRINLVGQTIIGSGSGTPEFLLDLSRVHFEAWESSRPNDEIASQKLTFKALYDVTNANIINSCTLKNTATSY